MVTLSYKEMVEKWGIFEISLEGPEEGNPFTEQWVRATFVCPGEKKTVNGFYDGSGRYIVRFMPSFEGEYSFAVETSFFEEKREGKFQVTKQQEGNHGPVRVAGTYHMAYEDGTPYYSLGTTCYVWELQSDERIAQTLESLEEAGFNKIRFCIFPKHYAYNLKDPRSFPYEGTPMDCSVLNVDNFWGYTGKTEGNDWQFDRFNPAHFTHIESCILALQKIGVEADLILMHPYDRWGFSNMGAEADDLYLRYVTARFSAFRNVWWSLANEYDLMEHKTIADWERFATIICENDPYGHLRSVHNCVPFYDYNRPWVTHCSIQRQELYRSGELVSQWREQYRKPVVLDEIAYEGNIQYGWGNITGEEMLRRFWEAAVRGGYPGHGETYFSPDDVLWWSHGGVLHGESHKRMKFLHKILCDTPGIGLKPYNREWDEVCGIPEDGAKARETGYHLMYYSFMRPSFREYYFDDENTYEAEVIDTWNMTIEKAGTYKGRFRVPLPGKQYMAVRVRKVNTDVE